MHIDHSKLVELLVETSGIEKEKVEAQLEELLTEIKATIEEGDAYEVEGLGVFSGIGNNVIFIPSDELSTEINYKYVGMEPIEMDDGPGTEQKTEAPKETTEADLDDDDPFAGLLGDLDSEEPSQPAASFELDVPEDEEEEPSEPEDSQETPEEQEKDPFDLDDEENVEEQEPKTEEKPGPDKWGIDTYKDDTAENTFSGLLGDKDEETEKEEKESVEEEHFLDFLDEDEDAEEQEEKSVLDDFKELNEEETASDDEEKEEDFDDPFKDLARELEEEEDEEYEEKDDLISEEEQEEPEEVIPVIKNLASESKKKEKAREEEQESEPVSKKSKKVAATDQKSQPVMLWILLLIIVLGGGTYALGYFGVVNIPGITPEQQFATSNTQTQPATQPETTPQQTQQPEQQPTTAQSEQQQAEPPQETQTTPVQEQEPPSQVSTDRKPPADQATYGMNGVPVTTANDGYTIVIYSLSRESNAKAKQRELSNQGYRVIVATVPSQQYGTLWRVSLGQFQTTRDAALAAEELARPFSENYFITKIK